jgi:hypothetical protein
VHVRHPIGTRLGGGRVYHTNTPIANLLQDSVRRQAAAIEDHWQEQLWRAGQWQQLRHGQPGAKATVPMPSAADSGCRVHAHAWHVSMH